MGSVAENLRRRSTAYATFEAQNPGAQQTDDELETENATVKRFLEAVGLSDGDIVRFVNEDNVDFIEFDVSASVLSTERAVANGAYRAVTLNEPLSPHDVLTRVQLKKSWSIMRNFDSKFKMVVTAALTCISLSTGYAIWRLAGYGNALDIAIGTIQEGLGLA